MSSSPAQTHPKGKRKKGSCDFIECTDSAQETRRVTRADGWPRMMVNVCEIHARAIDGHAPVLIEFFKG